MLQKLVIRNFAIIDNLVLNPCDELTTVTGETGAGKSIILGALSLILGDRADTSAIINKDEKTVIEGYFDVSGNAAFRSAVVTEGLDDEPQCIVRREIAVSGKSRAFINDTPVTLQTLNKLTSMLVDLQQQFGHLALEEDAFQINTIDAIADTTTDAAGYKTLYNKWRDTERLLLTKKEEYARQQQAADYRQYLLDELTQAAFSPNEIEQAEQQLKEMAHAEKIRATLQALSFGLSEGEQPMVNELRRLIQQLQHISDVFPSSAEVLERLQSAWAELKDIAGEVEVLQDKVTIDDELMAQLQQRADLGNKLLKKHAVTDTAGLLQLQEDLEQSMNSSKDLEAEIASLEQRLDKLYNDVTKAASRLSSARHKVVPGFEQEVTRLLGLVGMPNARLSVAITNTHPGPYGIDNIAFLIDANRSGSAQPLHKAASGGEMSRILLCIKSLVAKALHIPTLVFDEVDTVISGEAARQVGFLLRSLSAHHQVICITHQPQVAARGKCHFYVYKDAGKGDGRISTKVKLLLPDERIHAIARMIGGEQPSELAIANAKELMND